MSDFFAINIGRQLGSGGKVIGAKLAERLGAAFFDKELIQLASKESGLCQELFERVDEKPSGQSVRGFFGMPFSLYAESSMAYADYLSPDSLFQIQSQVIRQLVGKSNCVFVGRSADYVLREHDRCLNVFITADLETRIRNLCEIEHLTTEQAKDLIQRADKKRAEYYNYYSYKTWGAASTYHLCIDSSILGIDSTVDIIEGFARKKLQL